jgi:hypothetical protein
MNLGIRILHLPSTNGILGGDENLGNFLSVDGKTILEAGWAKVGERQEDVERIRKYYHIIIFPERT